MAGFGDVEGLKKSRFSPIDIPIMGAFISLIVQAFFCYRIWVLNRRLWWLCVIIAVVSPIPRTSRSWLKTSATIYNYDSFPLPRPPGHCGVDSRRVLIVSLRSRCGVRSDTPWALDPLSQSAALGKYAVVKPSLYVCFLSTMWAFP